MDISRWPLWLSALAALTQIPWFVLLSIARVRAGGSSAYPAVKRIDRLMPLPAFLGALLGVAQLWQLDGHGGPMLWAGALACAGLSAVFLRVMLR